jgi:hypothetical protein
MNAHLRLHNIFRSQQYCLNSSLFHNGPHHPLQRSRQCPPRCRSQQREASAAQGGCQGYTCESYAAVMVVG